MRGVLTTVFALGAAKATLRAVKDFVCGHAKKPGHYFGKREDFAVTLLTGVGGLNLDRLIGDLPVGIELEL